MQVSFIRGHSFSWIFTSVTGLRFSFESWTNDDDAIQFLYTVYILLSKQLHNTDNNSLLSTH